MAGRGYDLFKVKERMGMQDPLMGPKERFHTTLFVETDADGGGMRFHVTGDVVQGMRYESKKSSKPELSETFVTKTFLGRVPIEQFPDHLESILMGIPAPSRQRIFVPERMRYEQCKPDGTLYSAEEEKPPYFKCTEWIEEKAIPALLHGQIVKHDVAKANPLQ